MHDLGEFTDTTMHYLSLPTKAGTMSLRLYVDSMRDVAWICDVTIDGGTKCKFGVRIHSAAA